MTKPFACSKRDMEPDQTAEAVQEIMEACGVKEDDQERIWFAVFAIVDRQQNIWFNIGKRDAKAAEK
jgi:hypothetical protein